MIIEDKEVSLSRVFLIVGVIVFFSSLIYISVLTSKLIALRKNRVLRDNLAKEKYLTTGVGSSMPNTSYGNAISIGTGATSPESGNINAQNSGNLNPALGFTVEAFINANNGQDNVDIVSKAGSNISFKLSMIPNLGVGGSSPHPTSRYMFTVGNGSCLPQTVSFDRSPDESWWNHVAGVIQPSGQINIFVDGQMGKSTAFIDQICKNNASVNIGSINSPYFRGSIDEVRISNTARYQQSFTKPVTPFTNDAYTQLLYHLDNDPRSMMPGLTTPDSSSFNRNGALMRDFRFDYSFIY